VLICLGFAALNSIALNAQQWVSGYVKDKNTFEPLPFANVTIPGSGQGSATDTLGYFRFALRDDADSLRVSCLGYRTQTLALADADTVFLEPVAAELGVFNVVPGENPAFRILDSVVAAKSRLNMRLRERVQYREYQKIRFDLNHFTDKIKRNFLLRPFDYLWDNEGLDSNGVRYLPALLIEKAVAHYNDRGQREKSILEGEKITGLAGPRLLEFSQDLYILPDLYLPFINVLDKQFPSPVHDQYNRYYRYYLMDSIAVNGRKTYIISYKPRFLSQRAFSGVLKIDSADAAVVDVSLKFDVQANVNFVRSYLITQSYRRFNNQYWVVDSSRVLGDFTVVENSADLTGFFGRKISVFYAYDMQSDFSDQVFAGPLNVEVSDSARSRKEDYWAQQRKVLLDEPDKGIEQMTNRLETDPRFIFRKNLFVAVGSGYIPFSGAAVGDIYSFYNYNQVEFGRFKLAARVTENDRRPYEIAAHLAYGLRDERWKYGVSGFYRHDLKKHSKWWAGGEYFYDIEQIGRSDRLIAIDHLFASLGQFPDDVSRYYSRKASVFTAVQPLAGVSFLVDYRFHQAEMIFLAPPESELVLPGVYEAGSVGFTARFSWKNTKMNPFGRDEVAFVKRFSPFPEVTLTGRLADPGLGGDSRFQSLRIVLNQHFKMGNMGYTHYRLEGAKTWGNVPYVFAAVPYANQTLFNDQVAFNLMNFMEFFADEFAGLHLWHHFDGWILDKVPLLNKLKWRSFVFGKALVGSANPANPLLDFLPQRTARLSAPYYEWGFGIENIFKFARIDFSWRATQNNSLQTHYTFMVKPSFQFTF
jgi:hypothetical protein